MVQSDVQVSYAGIRTFARAPEGTVQGLSPGQVAVLGAEHDATSSARQGVREGPRGIRNASVDFIYNLQTSGTLEDIITGHTLTLRQSRTLVDLGDVVIYPTDLPRTERTLRETLASIIARDAFPVVLGGDHYITYPLFLGFAEALKQRGEKAGLIQLSGSLDLAAGHPTWGENWHGATLRRVVDSKALDPANLVWLGVHGFLPYAEMRLAESIGATVITLRSLRELGVEAAAARALEVAGRGCDRIYVSLDIGVVDPSYAAGQGDVVIGGLVPEELLDLMRALRSPTVGALDVVEVAPPIDPTERTTRLAAEAIIELIAPRAFS